MLHYDYGRNTVQVFTHWDAHNQASFGAPSLISSRRSADAIKCKAMPVGRSTVCSCSFIIRPMFKKMLSLFRVQGASLSVQSGRCPASASSASASVSWAQE